MQIIQKNQHKLKYEILQINLIAEDINEGCGGIIL